MSELIRLGILQIEGTITVALLKEMEDSLPNFIKDEKLCETELYIPDGTRIEIRGKPIGEPEIKKEDLATPEEHETPPVALEKPEPKKAKEIKKLPKKRDKKTMKEKILDSMQDGKPKSYMEITNEIGGHSPNSVSSVLTTMKKEGSVLCENKKFSISGKPSKPAEGPPKPTARSEKKEQRKQKILDAIKEDPGTHIDELASMLNMDKTKIRNIAREFIESGEIFNVKRGHKNMLFLKGTDPEPYLPVKPETKILEALQHGPKTRSELTDVTGIAYPNLSNPISDLMKSDEIHSARFKVGGRHEKILYALKGMEIPVPETKPTQKDKKEERLSKFLEDIIPILKGRELTLAQIAEEYLGKSVDEGGEEFRKFANDFGKAYNRGSIGKKKTEKGNVYFLEGYDQRPEGVM